MGDTPNGVAVAPIVVVGWVEIAAIEVEVVRVGAAVGCTRPIVAVGADIVGRAIVVVAGSPQ